MRKYELTNQTKVTEGRTMYRIKALRDFGDVKAGVLGGWIENEHNLSHEGNCWIFFSGSVEDWGSSEMMRIRGNAVISDRAQVNDDAVVKDWPGSRVMV